jgi:hypothetical protein
MADLAHGYSPSAPRSHRAGGACSLSDSAGCGAREASRKLSTIRHAGAVRVRAQRVGFGLPWRFGRYAVAIEAETGLNPCGGSRQKIKGMDARE